jgi:putative PIN family toxin of toxin-antitoxin system
MKVIVDTNVFLSYLLAPDRQGVVATVVTACLSLDEIDLLAPPEQLAEFAGKAATKPYVRSRIPHDAINHFVAQLQAFSEMQPPPETPTAYSRDPKDDFLAAYGVVNEADYLITGDQDLLVLQQVGQLRVVTPAQFVAVLRSHGLLS